MEKNKSTPLKTRKQFQLSTSLNKVSCNNELIFVSDIEGNAVVWSEQKEIVSFNTGHRDLVSAAFNSGFVTAGRWESSIKYWEKDSNSAKWEVKLPRSRIYSLSEMDGKMLVSYSEIDKDKKSLKDNVILKPSKVIAIDEKGNYELLFEAEHLQIKLIKGGNSKFIYATKEGVNVSNSAKSKIENSFRLVSEVRTLGSYSEGFFFSDDSGIYHSNMVPEKVMEFVSSDLRITELLYVGNKYFGLTSAGVITLPERTKVSSSRQPAIDIAADGEWIVILYKNRKVEIWEASSLTLKQKVSLS